MAMEINQELLDKIKAEAEQKKAEKQAKKELRKAKRKMFVQEHKMLLTGIGVGTALTIGKIVRGVMAEMNKKDDAPAEDTNTAWRNGYQNGWYDASEQSVDQDAPVDPVDTPTEE